MLLLLGVGAMVTLMVQDIRRVVSIIPGRDPEEALPIQMQNAEIRKTLSRDRWNVKAPILEKAGNLLRGRSLDVRMENPQGKGASFFAREGSVNLETRQAQLFHFRGSLWDESAGSFISVVASQGQWESEKNLLLLEKGFIFSSDKGVGRGDSGVLFPDGTIEIRNDTEIEWEVRE